jgi:protein EFR3
VAGQVAGASVSTSPLPYGTMTSQCEALGLGTRKKLSSWLVNVHESTVDNPMPSLPKAHQSIIPRVRRLINREHAY